MAGEPSESETASDVSQEETLAPIDFSTFVMSLATSAMVNLGRMPGPDGEQANANMPAAKQIIDILGILEQKTKGNLSDSENKLLTSLLTDLRIQYVEASKS
jgi:hypothetical protein